MSLNVVNHASTSQSVLCMCLPKHGDISVCDELQFSQPWKCSSIVASAVHSALNDGAIRVQEHAARSAINDSSRVRERLFPRVQVR